MLGAFSPSSPLSRMGVIEPRCGSERSGDLSEVSQPVSDMARIQNQVCVTLKLKNSLLPSCFSQIARHLRIELWSRHSH